MCECVSTHCCWQSGCQCHFQIPLQTHEGWHQDKHLRDLLEHLPVLKTKQKNCTVKLLFAKTQLAPCFLKCVLHWSLSLSFQHLLTVYRRKIQQVPKLNYLLEICWKNMPVISNQTTHTHSYTLHICGLINTRTAASEWAGWVATVFLSNHILCGQISTSAFIWRKQQH